MPIIAIEELEKTIPSGAAFAGLDLGERTIGIAISDALWQFAHPRPVIARTKFRADAKTLLDVLDREKVAAIVIGLPVNMDASEGPRAQSTRAFMRNLAKIKDYPVVFWDERLSTVAAERSLLEMDISRRKRAERIDSAAAAFILQGALDRLRSLRAR